ncbi:MAG TPA: hypothetical protein VFY13_05145 [Luteolibacter sp.]|nr:hypothetical protein [Luteolibacter sp.]
MKSFFLILIPCWLAAHALAGDEAPANITFDNKDHMSGKLVALDQTSLLWDSEILAQPARFQIKDVSELTLPGQLEAPEAGHIATITLKSDLNPKEDVVRGQLAAVTDESITLDTWFAGRLALRRSMVKDIQIEGRSSLFYRGPYNLDGWVQTEKDAWRYDNLSIISQKAGSIARSTLNADECSTKFTIQRRSESLNLKVVVFSDDLKNTTPRSGYELNFQRSSVYLRSGKNRDYIGSSHSTDLYQNDKVRVEIRASRKTGKVHLLINNQLLDSWSDPQVAENAFGAGLHFVTNDNNGISISEIEVAPWDGKITETPQVGMQRRGMFLRGAIVPDEGDIQAEKAAEEPQAEEQNRMKLANGDSIKGDIKSIQDGLIELTTPLGDILLPIERMRTLRLDKLGSASSKLETGDVRATFADGSTLIFRIERIEENHLVGTSQNFGEARFKLSAIIRIEFDIHERTINELLGK